MIEHVSNLMNIPEDLESAVLGLKDLGELVTAAEWQRAALVFAFTYEGRPGGRSTGQECAVALTMDEFSKLGLVGLSSRTTVRRYRQAWKLAIQDGFATFVMPGDEIALPEVDWNAYFNPPKPPRAPKEKRGRASTHPRGESVSEGDSDGITDAGESGIDLDATKPGNKWAAKGLLLVEGIETKRVSEQYRGGLERIKDALAGIAQPGADADIWYLKAAQALADLTASLDAETSQ
ncbi:hypothetical protein ACWDYH_00425 [Nocardia goodfellowii]